ncbi:conserved Plasmodium protein, unknown function [Plasmodium relictum]|uniref:Uncharacterized protein n=1 Tax=Plasmodium relictum TaxID=85471 RepID=A0A1J1H6T9_PLARL|nr:conserved Plasmodium protein, unknown function [Plasmodium relictum]CRH00252.1 conserved Plasmodium protein, unknown function [Plasmodium relictum]
MLIESKKKVKNLIYECNEKLKLYIKIKQTFKKSIIDKNTKELDDIYNQCVESKLNNFSEIKYFDDDFTGEKKLITDIIDSLLNNYVENNDGCVISFNKYENLKTISNDIEYEKKNDCINDNYLGNLIEHFFVKIKKLSAKENENKIYKLRFGAFNFSNIYDLLEEYGENKEYYKKIKSCTFKYEKEKIYVSNHTNVQPKNELKKFNEKTKAIEFSDLEKLKDIMNFAEKKKRLLEKKLKMNEPFFYTLITIDIIGAKKDNLVKTSMSNNYNKYILDRFYFLNISYCNSDDEKEDINTDELRKSVYEIINLIKYYLYGNLKIDISNFNYVSKIANEICSDLKKIHLKIVLYLPCNYNKIDENILNFLYSLDLKLKDYLNLFGNNLTKLENANYNLRDDKDFIISNSEKYQKLDRILFENIDLDENLKYSIMKEALNFPEESFDCLSLLNKTFQHNYNFYKEKEKEFHRNILNLVEKQNEIIKSYEEKENKKKDEINNILKEIYCINEKNLEIENEIQRHQNLNMKYLQKEENNELQNLKRLYTVDRILDKEYENFLEFRNESINNQEKAIKKEKTFQKIQDNNTSNDILDICEKQKEEYANNLNEALKYGEQYFQQTHNLKKKCDDAIRKKIELFKILKTTLINLNEKTNSLKDNFKVTKELKFIYPIDDNYISFNEKYRNYSRSNSLKEYNELLEELTKNDFNEKQIKWIYKMNSISKKL